MRVGVERVTEESIRETAKKMTHQQRIERIREIKNTPDAMVASDSGTHGGPRRYDIWQSADGRKHARKHFAGSYISSTTIAEAEADTDGKIRWFADESLRMDRLVRELRVLEQMV